MLVNEIFYSIQGEGPYVGRPSVFLRLAGCNLQCIWCDTKYTWLYSRKQAQELINTQRHLGKPVFELEIYNKEMETKHKSVTEIIQEIRRYPTNTVVITGGEPLLQKKELHELISLLLQQNYNVEIETNGTIPPFNDNMSKHIHYNVSPKLANSLNAKEKRYKPNVLQAFMNVKAIFKFVIASQNDFQEAMEIIHDLGIPHHRVYFMPEGSSVKGLNEKTQWIIEKCKELNINFTYRLHILLWGNKRAV